MNPSKEGPPDPAALRDTLTQAYPALVSFFRHRMPVHLHEQAEDLAQETLLAAWSALAHGSARRVRNLTQYLLGIARNKSHDALRQSYRQTYVPLVSDSLDGFPGQVADAAADRRLLEAEYQNRLMRALAKLRPRERQVLNYRFFERLGNDEACRRMGISPEEGSRLKYRAIEKLRFLLRAKKAGRIALLLRHSK